MKSVFDFTERPKPANPDGQLPKRTQARIARAALQYRGQQMRVSTFQSPEYDLAEIARAADVEAIINISLLKHITLVMKEGFNITGSNPETVNYVYRRIREIELATGQTFFEIVQQIVHDVVYFSNAFLIIVRSNKYSEEGKRQEFGVDRSPIVGVFPCDPTSMSVKRDRYGTIQRWRQEIEGQSEEWPPYNVIHVPWNKKTGFTFGTPWILPALDDARTLRRIEELDEIVHHKLAFPLYHVAVGTDMDPAREYDDGTSEIDIVKQRIEDIPFDGVFITPHRHVIEVIGAKNAALDLTKAKEYYLSRLIGGVGMSEIDFGAGDSANRGTAQVQSRGLFDRGKMIQNVVAEALNFYLLDQILEEGGYPLSATNRVFFEFTEIDLERRQTIDNNAADLFTKDVITLKEARERMGLEPMSDEQWMDTHFNRIGKWPVLVSLAAASSKTVPSGTPGGAPKPVNIGLSPEEVGKNPTGGAIATKNRPSNQFGKKPAKTLPRNDTLVDAWNKMRDLGTKDLQDSAKSEILRSLGQLVLIRCHQRIQDGMDSYQPGLFVGANILNNYLDRVIAPMFQSVLDRMIERHSPADPSLFDATLGLMHVAYDRCLSSAFAYGYAKAAQINKQSTVFGLPVRGISSSNIDLMRDRVAECTQTKDALRHASTGPADAGSRVSC